MTKKFIDRVLAERIVDTKTYRYIAKQLDDRCEIQRLPIISLDTTAAIDGWETVHTIR